MHKQGRDRVFTTAAATPRGERVHPKDTGYQKKSRWSL